MPAAEAGTSTGGEVSDEFGPADIDPDIDPDPRLVLPPRHSR
ncbi:hypothetical protein ACN6K4_000455 [Streptomyces hayashii]